MAKTKCIKFDLCYFSNTYFGPPAIAGRVLWSRVYLSGLLSFCLSMDFLAIASSGFSRFLHGAKNPYEVVCDQKFRKMGQKWPTTWFFEFTEKFSHYFLLNLFYNEYSYYLLCSCTNRIFGKILFHEIWAKCSQPIRLQDYLINHIFRTNQGNSLIFCMLIQIHIN